MKEIENAQAIWPINEKPSIQVIIRWNKTTMKNHYYCIRFKRKFLETLPIFKLRIEGFKQFIPGIPPVVILRSSFSLFFCILFKIL